MWCPRDFQWSGSHEGKCAKCDENYAAVASGACQECTGGQVSDGAVACHDPTPAGRQANSWNYLECGCGSDEGKYVKCDDNFIKRDCVCFECQEGDVWRQALN